MEVSPCHPLIESFGVSFLLFCYGLLMQSRPLCDYLDPATTIIFVQSNHVYAGGDPGAFQSRFPAPVTTVTLKFIPNVTV